MSAISDYLDRQLSTTRGHIVTPVGIVHLKPLQYTEADARIVIQRIGLRSQLVPEMCVAYAHLGGYTLEVYERIDDVAGHSQGVTLWPDDTLESLREL